MRFALLHLMCLAAIADASYGLFGPDDCAGVAGNGRLTIAFDHFGRLSMCRWPEPTAPNQLTYTELDGTVRGAKWAMDDGDGVRWVVSNTPGATRMQDGSAPVIEMADVSTGVVQTAFVVPERDIAVFQLRFLEQPQQNSVLWHSDFSPCPSSMRAVPGSERLFATRADMVAFNEGAMYHARPADAHSVAWEETNRWLTGGLIPQWMKKGAAVWIGYAAPETFLHAVCSTRAQDELADARTMRAVGQCYSVVRVPLDPADNTATIFLAAGERRSNVDDSLAFAKQQGYEQLLRSTTEWWETRVAQAVRPQFSNPAISPLYTRALRQLLVAADPRSGAVSRAAVADSPLFVDVTRQGAWTTLALDLAGYRDEASAHLDFYANAVRQDGSQSAPIGSLPAALYATGVEAAPDVVLDVQAAGWFLWSAWQHDAFLAEEHREAYRKKLWGAVNRTGDFISSWARAAHDTPALSFEPEVLRDSASIETFAIAHAGLRSAASFAQATGEEKPEWASRVTEMADVLRFQALDADGLFKTADPLAIWPADLVPAGDPRWAAAVYYALESIENNSPAESLEILARAAMVMRDQKENLASLEPLLAPVIQRALDAYPCDTYYASLSLAAILTTYSHGAY